MRSLPSQNSYITVLTEHHTKHLTVTVIHFVNLLRVDLVPHLMHACTA